MSYKTVYSEGHDSRIALGDELCCVEMKRGVDVDPTFQILHHDSRDVHIFPNNLCFFRRVLV